MSTLRRSTTFPILDVLGQDERRAILDDARRRRFDRGEVVFHAGDPADSLHLISWGRVVVRRTTHGGQTAIFGFLGPGEFFGEMALLSPSPPLTRNATVEAAEPSQTLSIRAERFDEVRRRHPAVDRFLVALLAARVAELDDQLVEALLVPAEVRVIRRLLAAAARLTPQGEGPVPLTQEDLARMAGTSRATANRALRRAAEAGLIRIRRGRIEILDGGTLAKGAG